MVRPARLLEDLPRLLAGRRPRLQLRVEGPQELHPPDPERDLPRLLRPFRHPGAKLRHRERRPQLEAPPRPDPVARLDLLASLPQRRPQRVEVEKELDRKSTRLNSSHSQISYAVFCLKKKNHRNVLRNALDTS